MSGRRRRRNTAALAGLGGEKADQEAAIGSLEAIAAGEGSYAILARLRAAARSWKMVITPARWRYNAIAENPASPPELRDLAFCWRSPPTWTMAIARPWWHAWRATAGHPWRPGGRNASALALKAGDIARARALFTELSDDAATPERLRGGPPIAARVSQKVPRVSASV